MLSGFSSLNLNVSQILRSDFLLCKHRIVDRSMAMSRPSCVWLSNCVLMYLEYVLQNPSVE